MAFGPASGQPSPGHLASLDSPFTKGYHNVDENNRSTHHRRRLCPDERISPISERPAAAADGSGNNLLIPSPNSGQPDYQIRDLGNSVVHPTSFDGTWTAPALSPWIGTFNARGPVPAVSANTGVTHYDFTGLNPAGYLPSGTFFRFGDVDMVTEIFTLTAINSNGIPSTGDWLTVPGGVWGSGNGVGGVPILTDMPSWSLVNG
ncbi:MAG: hypothetical protein IIC49_06415, partial [Planctomycetes bacterium]|nr:hypothetical protein [Planctomycetota bacterium]